MSELSNGIRTEKEHKDVIQFIEKHYKLYGKPPSRDAIYRRIALDHLSEDKHYYTKLLKAKL